MFSYIIFALVGSLVAAAIDLSAVEDLLRTCPHLPTPSLVRGQVAFATKTTKQPTQIALLCQSGLHAGVLELSRPPRPGP